MKRRIPVTQRRLRDALAKIKLATLGAFVACWGLLTAPQQATAQTYNPLPYSTVSSGTTQPYGITGLSAAGLGIFGWNPNSGFQDELALFTMGSGGSGIGAGTHGLIGVCGVGPTCAVPVSNSIANPLLGEISYGMNIAVVDTNNNLHTVSSSPYSGTSSVPITTATPYGFFGEGGSDYLLRPGGYPTSGPNFNAARVDSQGNTYTVPGSSTGSYTFTGSPTSINLTGVGGFTTASFTIESTGTATGPVLITEGDGFPTTATPQPVTPAVCTSSLNVITNIGQLTAPGVANQYTSWTCPIAPHSVVNLAYGGSGIVVYWSFGGAQSSQGIFGITQTARNSAGPTYTTICDDSASATFSGTGLNSTPIVANTTQTIHICRVTAYGSGTLQFYNGTIVAGVSTCTLGGSGPNATPYPNTIALPLTGTALTIGGATNVVYTGAYEAPLCAYVGGGTGSNVSFEIQYALY